VIHVIGVGDEFVDEGSVPNVPSTNS